MARDKKKGASGRIRAAGGRVTMKPCVARPDDNYCAPLNHIVAADGEYWTCSCGRRYSPNGHRKFVKANPEWRSAAAADTTAPS